MTETENMDKILASFDALWGGHQALGEYGMTTMNSAVGVAAADDFIRAFERLGRFTGAANVTIAFATAP